MTSAKRNVRGFTLIELVVAITILGLLAAVVSSGLHTGLRAWSRGNSELDDMRALQTTLFVLRSQIQGALPLLYVEGVDRRPKPAFQGESLKLRFVSRTSFRDGPQGPPRWVELTSESTGNAGRLVAKEFAIVPPDGAPASEPLWQGLVLEGNEFRLQYLSRPTVSKKVSWMDAWPQDRLELPAAIRLTFAHRGRRHDIVLPLDYADNSSKGQWFQ